MANTSQIFPTALGETYQKPIFSKEVEGWFGRATPADRERFERVFESIRSIAEAKKSPDAHSKFVESTLSKLKQRSASASKARTPPPAHGAPSVVCNGWSYTATRAAFARPETRTSLLSLQDQAAAQHERELQDQQRQMQLDFPEAERPSSAPGAGPPDSSDRDLSALQQAAARRRALSFGEGAGGGSSVSAAAAAATEAAAAAAAAAIASVAGSTPPSGGGGGHNTSASSPRDAGAGGAAGSVASTGRDAGSGFVAISPHATRYQETFNLRSAYPEVYDQALRDTRVQPVPNQTFVSEWGNSLKSGADEAAKLYWRTTYNTTNDEVIKWKTDADVTREKQFFKWMQRQRTFFGDVLSPEKAKDLETVLAGATDEQKREILEVMRTTHAAMDTAIDRTRSHSQTIHGDMRRVEDEKLEAMLREHTKARTMGQPIQRHTVAKRRPATATAAGSTVSSSHAELKPNTVNLTLGGPAGADGEGGAGTGAGSGKGLKPSRRPATAGAALISRKSLVPPPKRADVDMSDTFRSRLPLQWPSGQQGPAISTYVDTFGGAKIGVSKQRPNSALFKAEPVKYTDTTCPFGAVNPHTAAAPLRASYPVPERFTAVGSIPFPQPEGVTSYRNEFAPRDPEDVAAQARAAAALVENSRKLLNRGSVPLGSRTGINVLPSSQWISETKESFVPYDVDPREPYERAQVMKALFMAPTGTGGKMTLARAQSSRGRAGRVQSGRGAY